MSSHPMCIGYYQEDNSWQRCLEKNFLIYGLRGDVNLYSLSRKINRTTLCAQETPLLGFKYRKMRGSRATSCSRFMAATVGGKTDIRRKKLLKGMCVCKLSSVLNAAGDHGALSTADMKDLG